MSAVLTEEAFTELDTLAYDVSAIMPELVLLTSLALRARAVFTSDLSYSYEARTELRRSRGRWLELLVPNLSAGVREMFNMHIQPSNELLPDTCIQCSNSFGLTVSGRLRRVCPSCTEESTGKGTRFYLSIQEELGVYFVPSALFEQVISQLLYKYYAPNGDRTWTLKLPTLD